MTTSTPCPIRFVPAMRIVGRIAGRIACACAIALWQSGSAWAGVEVVMGEGGPPYEEARAALAAQLTGIELNTVSIASRTVDGRRSRSIDLTVTLGSDALRAVLGSTDPTPVVALLAPRTSFDRIREEARPAAERRISAVYLDQPWSRQIGLIRLIAPERTRIGLLTTEAFAPQLPELRRAARDHKATIVHELVESPQALHVDLMRIIGTADTLLAVPDTRVFNASTIQHILLTTFRARQPLFGFSAAYVQAGALAAVYSTPTQMGRQAATLVRRALAGQPLPGPQYPQSFVVTVNRSVARSLDLTVAEDAALAAGLEQMERAR